MSDGLNMENRKLLIGGEEKAEGWEILNILPGKHVDHIGDAKDLSCFADGVFNEIYASHVLEHFDHNGTIDIALVEWNRVLRSGGTLYVSVPDMDVLSDLFLAKDKFTANDRFKIMRMIFGGHTNEHDYHYIGLNEEFLTFYLRQTGFVNIKKVERLGLFNDTSELEIDNRLVSLNMVAQKPIS